VRRLFSVTTWLIALVAAGMAGQAAAILANIDLIPSWGFELWDTSWLLPQDNILGRALHALVGYSDRPMGVQVAAYLAVLAVLGIAAVESKRDRHKPRPPRPPLEARNEFNEGGSDEARNKTSRAGGGGCRGGAGAGGRGTRILRRRARAQERHGDRRQLSHRHRDGADDAEHGARRRRHPSRSRRACDRRQHLRLSGIYGYPDGAWIAYLTIAYTLEKQGTGWKASGTLKPMTAKDGPHYADNVKMNGPGSYKVTYGFKPPEANGFYRHIDQETGVPAWWQPFSETFTFAYPQK
jgi:hypothetical protein